MSDRFEDTTFRIRPGTSKQGISKWYGDGAANGLQARLAPGACLLAAILVATSAGGDTITVPINADGTFGAGVPNTDAYEITVYEGDRVDWVNLTPLDSIVQIAGLPAPGADVCTDPALARPFNLAVPYAAGPDELTAPLKNSPAGVIALSPNDCGLYEVPDTQSCGTDHQLVQLNGKFLCGRDKSVCEPDRGGNVDLKYMVMPETWQNPDVAGVFLRLDWRDLEPMPDAYNWAFLDRELQQAARNGKVAVIGVRLGNNSIPDWLFDGTVADGAEPVDLRESGGPPRSFPGATCGSRYRLASPADVNFRNHLTDLIGEMGSHLAADARLYQHVGGVKVTGLGLHTLENRAPNRCHLKDPGNNQLIDPADPFANGSDHTGGLNYLYQTSPGNGSYETVNAAASCACNPQIWAEAVHPYKPSELYRFYRYVESAIDQAFRHKAKVFMLIQAGWPQVGENGGYEGDRLTTYDPATRTSAQSSAEGVDYPRGTEQTEELLAQGREGRWLSPEFGNTANTANGLSFVVSHQALSGLPQESGNPACAQQAAIDTAVGPNFGSPQFPIPSGSAISGGGGCPNRWAAEEGIRHGLNTGFQTTTEIDTSAEVDSSLWNMTANSNATYYENYEKVFWLLANEVTPGTGALRPPLGPAPASFPGGVAKNLHEWNTLLRWRRAQLETVHAGHTIMLDPNPTTFSRPFLKDIAPGAVETYYYINPRVCGTSPTKYMKLTYIGR